MAKSKIQLSDLLSLQNNLPAFRDALLEHLQFSKKYDTLLVLQSLTLNVDLQNTILFHIFERAPKDIFEAVFSLKTPEQQSFFLSNNAHLIRARLNKIHEYPSLKSFKEQYQSEFNYDSVMDLECSDDDIIYFLENSTIPNLIKHFSHYTVEQLDTLFIKLRCMRPAPAVLGKCLALYQELHQDPWMMKLPFLKKVHVGLGPLYGHINNHISPILELHETNIKIPRNNLWHTYKNAFKYDSNVDRYDEISITRAGYKQMLHMLNNPYVREHLKGHTFSFSFSERNHTYMSLVAAIVTGELPQYPNEVIIQALAVMYHPNLFTSHMKYLKNVDSSGLRFLASLALIPEDKIEHMITVFELQTNINLKNIKKFSDLTPVADVLLSFLHNMYKEFHIEQDYVFNEIDLVI